MLSASRPLSSCSPCCSRSPACRQLSMRRMRPYVRPRVLDCRQLPRPRKNNHCNMAPPVDPTPMRLWDDQTLALLPVDTTPGQRNAELMEDKDGMCMRRGLRWKQPPRAGRLRWAPSRAHARTPPRAVLLPQILSVRLHVRRHLPLASMG
jgi:hypothetical protein